MAIPKTGLNYTRTQITAGTIKAVTAFGTLFAVGEITNAGTNQANVGGISVRVDNGPWCPFVVNRGFRLDEAGHRLEIQNTTANLTLWVGFYSGDADMFTIT